MQVEEETPGRLVLVHRPWAMGAALGVAVVAVAMMAVSLGAEGDAPGAVMIGLGAVLCAGAAFVFVRPARVVLDRGTGTVEVVEWTALGRRMRGAPLAEVTGATVSRSRGTFRPGDRRASRAVVTLRSGAVLPLAEAHMGHRPASRAVAAINRWLRQA
ncbi:MAG: hypothetical protein ACK4L4_07955 [Gemmobacter sp.]